MSLADISAFFDQSIPIGIVFIIIYLVKMGQKINYVEKHLNNHITDTNKKIDHLTNDMNNRFNDMNNRLDKMDSRFDKIDSRFDKIDSRFDKLFDYLIKNK